VTLETDPVSGRKIAVKHMTTSLLDKDQFLREIEFLAILNHPCVLRILGWSFPSESNEATIQTEYAENGSLASVLKRAQIGPKVHFWNATGKGVIICGMSCVHSRGIMHRDLKPLNIMINGLGEALIGDFGTGRYEYDDATLTGETGTDNYTAP
jgi:serine/threonine protein kinase